MSKTYGEQFKEALACTTREEAAQWMENEVREFVACHGKTAEEAAKIIRDNIGYMAGYYGEEEQQKIKTLFDAPHPIFGDDAWPPNPQKAFDAGTKTADHNGMALATSKPEISG